MDEEDVKTVPQQHTKVAGAESDSDDDWGEWS